MEPILEAKKLNLWYGPNHALHDVSIAIPEHEITAFIGPSGCGKSTFLRTLNRMNDLIPSVKLSGEVDFHGQDLYGAALWTPHGSASRSAWCFRRPTHSL